MPVRNLSLKGKLNGYFTPADFVIEALDENFLMKADPNDPCVKWAKRFEADKIKALFHLGFLTPENWFSPTVEFLYTLSDLLITKLSRTVGIELERENVVAELTEDEMNQLKGQVPFALGMEYVNHMWMRSIWERLLEVFKAEISEFDGPVATYFAEKNAQIHVAGRIFFHLVENQEDAYPFAFMATYSKKPPKSKKTIHTPLKNALEEFKDDEKRLITLISAVLKVSDQSHFISGLMESGELFSPIKLTHSEAYTFLKEVPLYEEAGIMCRVPDWWRKKKNSLKISVNVGQKPPSKVGMDAILDFSPTFYIGDTPATEAEIREFLTMAEGLVKYKGKWVEVDKSKLQKALTAFERLMERGQRSPLSLSEAMRMELNTEEVLGVTPDDLEISVSHGEWFEKMRESLENPKKISKTAPVPTFQATLRQYQEDGYHWLQQMATFGFGACLADDMGLGKTVQVIAFLELIRSQSPYKSLLILPASLIGNWQKEIERFAPRMPYQILHPSAFSAKEDIQMDESAFLFITTYGMAKRLDMLKDKQWDILILDEAQAIKNPGTKQTKHIKEIPGRIKIAMTGTPIENQLGDLWSLFDFLNPGLLGDKKEFTDFAKQLNLNPAGYAKLRKMISPFLLRRLKTDKQIISDLPEKVEINEYAQLSKKQIALYRQLVDQIAEKIDETERKDRSGLVLSSIVKFKQICNHPDQYLGREDYKPTASGKFQQLAEICETIYEKREKVLVFTQFRELTEPLSEYLKEIFNKEGYVLHGGTSVKKRSEMVETFNSDRYIPYMVLSLKAGGVGLNLAAANHVIHFDRWWNPAVENQATDRAFRIGQSKNVMVHKFVTKGTIEEKIDEMINEKRKLAEDVLSSAGEKWISELGNDELMELFRLGGI